MSRIFIPNNLNRAQLDAFRSIEVELNRLSNEKTVITGSGAPTEVNNLQDGSIFYDFTNLNLYVFRLSDSTWNDPNLAAANASNAIASNIYVSGTETINGAVIADGTVTANEIATNAITAVKIVAGTITATEIAADAITTDKIAAGAITASEIAAGAVTANKITIAENIAFTGSTSGLIFGKTSLADTTAGSFYGKSLDAAGNAISGFNISSGSSGIYADSSGIMALNNVRLYTGSAGTALELSNPGTYATSIATSTTVISVIIVGAGAGAQNNMPINLNSQGQNVGGAGTASWIEFYSGPVVSGSVSGSLLNISGVTRFTAAGGASQSWTFGGTTGTGPSGQASSQAGSAGAGFAATSLSATTTWVAGHGSKGGGGGAGGGSTGTYWANHKATVSANAGATISQQFTLPTGTQSVKSFVGTGGSGGSGGQIGFTYLQGPEQNQIFRYAYSVRGGNGGDGFVSIADPNSGGIEVDLVALLNRVTALEGYH